MDGSFESLNVQKTSGCRRLGATPLASGTCGSCTGNAPTPQETSSSPYTAPRNHSLPAAMATMPSASPSRQGNLSRISSVPADAIVVPNRRAPADVAESRKGRHLRAPRGSSRSEGEVEDPDEEQHQRHVHDELQH